MQDMNSDPVLMNGLRVAARDQAAYQTRMTRQPHYVFQVNSDHPGAGFEYTANISQADVVRLTDLVTVQGEVIDLTVLRGLDRATRP